MRENEKNGRTAAEEIIAEARRKGEKLIATATIATLTGGEDDAFAIDVVIHHPELREKRVVVRRIFPLFNYRDTYECIDDIHRFLDETGVVKALLWSSHSPVGIHELRTTCRAATPEQCVGWV